MSRLPKQVQDQADQVAELEKSLAEPAPTTAPEPDSKPAEDQLPPDPAPEPVKPEPKAEETWQKRYQTLQGMFNAEVPRLNSQVKELTERLAQATAKLEAVAKAPAEPAKPASPLVTEKDVEAFGSDMIDLIKRQSAEVFQQEKREMQAELAKLQGENAELKSQLGGVTEKQVVTDRRSYYSELAKLVPDYEAVNVDPDFLNWLAETDHLSGMTRQTFLNAAFESFDTARTATLFNAWKEAAGRTQQPKQAVKQELSRQVAPGTSKSSAGQAPVAAERVWTAAEIQQYYTDVAKGAYRGKADEAARIESEIDAAVAAGRVR